MHEVLINCLFKLAHELSQFLAEDMVSSSSTQHSTLVEAQTSVIHDTMRKFSILLKDKNRLFEVNSNFPESAA